MLIEFRNKLAACSTQQVSAVTEKLVLERGLIMRLATHFGVYGRDVGKTIDFCNAFDIKYLCSMDWPEDLSAFKGQFEEEGITLAMMQIGWLREEMLFGDAPKRAELSSLVDKVKLIGDAGIEIGHMFVALDSSGEGHLDDEWERIIDFFRELGEHAEKHKVKISIHSGWTPEHIITDRATFKKLLDAVPSPYIGVNMCLGCFQVMSSTDIRQEIDETIAAFGDRLFMVHARDVVVGADYSWTDVAVGQGDIHLDIIIDRLYEAYRESHYAIDPIVLPEHMPKVAGEQANEISTAWALGYLSGMLKEKEWLGH